MAARAIAKPNTRATHELTQEDANGARRIALGDDGGRIGDGPRCQDADEQTEGCDGDGVVQERSALSQDRKPLRRTDIAEDADDGRRIGGRDHGAQQQANHDIHPGREVHNACNACDADQHRYNGQKKHRMDLVHQAAHIDGQAGGEEQRW